MCFMTREEENWAIRIVKNFCELFHLAVKIRPTLLVIERFIFFIGPEIWTKFFLLSSFQANSAEAVNHCTAIFDK